MYSNNVKKKAVKSRAFRASWRPEIEIFFLVGTVLATLLLVSPAMAQEGTAKIRMVHLSPDAPAVMIELDGEPVEALDSVSYRDASPYLDIPAGPHDVAVYAAADASEPVLEVSIAPEAGESYTVAGVGLLANDTFGARLFEDDTAEPDEGEARVRVIHAVPDVGPATVSVANGPDLFSLPGFANASDYVGVDAGTYTLEVTPAGAPEPAFDVPDVTVEEGETYTAFAIGQASEGTLDTMMTVDSDDGRVIGPKTLEDTSGDLSLLEQGDSEPRPESASTSNERLADRSAPAESSNPDSAKKAESAPSPENDGSEEAPKPEASQTEEVSVETSEAPAYVPPAPTTPAATPVSYTPPVAEPEIVVPTVAEIAPEPLVVETTFVPQPVETVPLASVAAPQIPIPTAEVPNVEVPSAEVPTVEVPPVPAVSGSWSSQTTVSTQTITGAVNAATNVASNVTNGVVAEGFVPPVSPQPVAVQNISRQAVGGGAVPVAPVPTVPVPTVPVDSVVGFVSNTPAIVNSGARRKFVTIRSKGRSLPNSA